MINPRLPFIKSCIARMLHSLSRSSSPAKAGDPVRRGLSAQAWRLWNTGSSGPAFAKGFGEATSSRARRSFSEGGKPGDDHKGLALDVRGELPLAASGDNTTMTFLLKTIASP
jgi:hypothetical protein